MTGADRHALLELAPFLDSVNLPADDPDAIDEVILASERSFSGEEPDAARRQYTFAIEHRPSGRIVGTSSVTGQAGRRDAPHIYFDVRTEERYSETLDRHFRHLKLQIGFSYDGPTALGGLVVHPDHRRTAHRVGSQIAFVRFLFVAMHRGAFQDRMVAELLPPLEPDGTSHLWEAVGRHFTGLSYREADRLSKKNKEFIRGLFPDGDIYVSLLPSQAQTVIGQVGPQTRGVAKMLSQVGFRYANRVDPFDGGPYFEATTDGVQAIQRARPVEARPGAESGGPRALLGLRLPEPPWFRAVAAPHQLVDAGRVALVPADALRALADGGHLSCPLWLLPLQPPGPR
ncbi:MAG: arginine N-succinyltransferase [Myxococcota bacterium]